MHSASLGTGLLTSSYGELSSEMCLSVATAVCAFRYSIPKASSGKRLLPNCSLWDCTTVGITADRHI